MTASTKRVCPSCKSLTPASRPNCAQCGQRFRNEMAWKIAIIALAVIVVIVINVLIELDPW